MSKLLNRSLKSFLLYAGIVLVCSIPVYYFIIYRWWQYELDEHNIVLTAEASREDTYLIIAAVTSLTVLFFVLIMAGLILLNRRISRRIWQPFYSSLTQIRKFDISRQDKVKFGATDIAEFAELNQSLEKLIDSSVAAYNQQKEFADNASHELQTPLAIVQSKLEVLMQSQSLTNTEYHVIEEALTALTRVTRINKNLLLLTKIENSQFMDREQIDLSGLLQHAISVFAPLSENKRLSIETNIAPSVTVDGNKILLEILLNNLIINAIRYCTPPGSIVISLTGKQLMISNDGIHSLNQHQLFKRFGAASSQTPGTGLGLALVKQISQRYGWMIEYAFNDQRHIFTLHFGT